MLVRSIDTPPDPSTGTLDAARKQYDEIKRAVLRGDTDQQIVAGCGVTDQTIRALRVDPLFIASCREAS